MNYSFNEYENYTRLEPVLPGKKFYIIKTQGLKLMNVIAQINFS